MARISTKVDQVVDVFYVQDLSGAKIEDEEFIKKIKEELRKDLEKIPLPKMKSGRKIRVSRTHRNR